MRAAAMRPRLVLAIAATAALFAAPAANAARDRCHAHGTHTIKLTNYLRVYEGKSYTDEWGDTFRETFACVRRTGKRQQLGEDPAVMATNGTWIAYESYEQVAMDVRDQGFAVIDAATGKETLGLWFDGDDWLVDFGSIVLRRDGAVGVIVGVSPSDPAGKPGYTEVRTNARGVKHASEDSNRGDGVRQDIGDGIQMDSLKLSGSKLSWTRDGATMTGRLPTP
jgi:hypothetical protein